MSWSPSGRTIVCTEVFDENSQPSEEEVRDYAAKIGIDVASEQHLLHLARDGLMRALPSGWKPCFDEDLQAWYYFNFRTGESRWEHPLDDVYRSLVRKGRSESISEAGDDDEKTSLKEDLRSYEEMVLPVKHQQPPLLQSPTSIDIDKMGVVSLVEATRGGKAALPQEKHPRNLHQGLTLTGGGAIFLKSRGILRRQEPEEPEPEDNRKSVRFNILDVRLPPQGEGDSRPQSPPEDQRSESLLEVGKLQRPESPEKEEEEKEKPASPESPEKEEGEPESPEEEEEGDEAVEVEDVPPPQPDTSESSECDSSSRSEEKEQEAEDETSAPVVAAPVAEETRLTEAEEDRPPSSEGVTSSEAAASSPSSQRQAGADETSPSSHKGAEESTPSSHKGADETSPSSHKGAEEVSSPSSQKGLGADESSPSSRKAAEEAESLIGRRVAEAEEACRRRLAEVEAAAEARLAALEAELALREAAVRAEAEARLAALRAELAAEAEALEETRRLLRRELSEQSAALERCRREQEAALREAQGAARRRLEAEDCQRGYEKLRCEKRLLEDKYRSLKEKYLRLYTDVKVSIEKRKRRDADHRKGPDNVTVAAASQCPASAAPVESDDNNNGGDPVENLRRQLQSLEDLEEQFPASPLTHADTYLRYPFADLSPGAAGVVGGGAAELEFFRHRIHLERDSVRRAKDFLRVQRDSFQARRSELRRREGSSSARTVLDQLYKEERELTDMEVSLHRTKSLLGEKIIRLRHLEQSLQRAGDCGASNSSTTLSDVSSHSGSSGFSSSATAPDAPWRRHYHEPTEIVHSLETLNTEIRDIWQVLHRRRKDQGISAGVPPAWPPVVPHHHQQLQDRSLVERTRSLRDWLRQARMDSPAAPANAASKAL